MTTHTKTSIAHHEQLLQGRFNVLVSAVRGDELVGRDASSCTRPDLFTNIDAQAIRLAIDDFAAILKEIKGTLGKR